MTPDPTTKDSQESSDDKLKGKQIIQIIENAHLAFMDREQVWEIQSLLGQGAEPNLVSGAGATTLELLLGKYGQADVTSCLASEVAGSLIKAGARLLEQGPMEPLLNDCNRGWRSRVFYYQTQAPKHLQRDEHGSTLAHLLARHNPSFLYNCLSDMKPDNMGVMLEWLQSEDHDGNTVLHEMWSENSALVKKWEEAAEPTEDSEKVDMLTKEWVTTLRATWSMTELLTTQYGLFLDTANHDGKTVLDFCIERIEQEHAVSIGGREIWTMVQAEMMRRTFEKQTPQAGGSGGRAVRL